MKVKKVLLQNKSFPALLREISSLPKQLYYLGADPEQRLARPRVAIVGSRAVTPYGRAATM